MNVKRSWLERGDTVELLLPRNLTCAACKGGGCDRCDRSGAITLRQRGVEAVPLKVPLPQRSAEDMRREPAMVLRIPEQGGEPGRGSDLPRGLLLLQIVAADQSDPGVNKQQTTVARRLSKRAPQKAVTSDVIEPESRAQPRSRLWGSLFLMLAVAWIAVILLLSARLPH
ncbi:MAG: hypothetical protein QM756_36875 [Polyangiaceae bacterium]